MTPSAVIARTLPLGWLRFLGEFGGFGWDAARACGSIWRRRGLFLRHCEFIGVNSTLIITVAGMFMGGVLGYQLYVSLHFFGAESLLGGSVGVALFRELAPVMTAIMVCGRAGAAMAAELSSMRVSEQIDALEVMGVDSIEYLVTPRVIAGALMVPLLSVYFGVVASVAAMGVACGVMGLDQAVFWDQFALVVDRMEILHCLAKGLVFGIILTWVGCFYGFRAVGGASAVGQATRTTVVVSCLAILFGDYLLTSLLPLGLPTLSLNS